MRTISVTVLNGSNCATPRGFNMSLIKECISPPDNVDNKNLDHCVIFFFEDLEYDEYGWNMGILFLLRCNRSNKSQLLLN